jgi:hypothetical protein
MGVDAVLGEQLHQATVTDSTILGGQTMRAYVADWSVLGSGERPWTSGVGEVIDVVDVADLESERAHAYELLDARDGEEVAHHGTSPGGRVVVDGGRTRRGVERFVAHLRPHVSTKGIVRLDGPPGCTVNVMANARHVAAFDIGDDASWVERSFDIPAEVASADTRIDLRAGGGTLTTFHYWFAVGQEPGGFRR